MAGLAAIKYTALRLVTPAGRGKLPLTSGSTNTRVSVFTAPAFEAYALADGATTTEIPVAKSKVAVAIETNFLIMM